MGWHENLIIIAGISLELFALMECQGSLVQKVNKKQLTVICLLVAMCQLTAIGLGYFLSSFLYDQLEIKNEVLIGQSLAFLIFLGLGGRLLFKAIKNEFLHERLEHKQDYKRYVKMALITGVYTILAGIAFGFLGTNVIMIMIMSISFSILFIVLGMYAGYHFGFQQKKKVYVLGVILLWLAGIDVLIRIL